MLRIVTLLFLTATMTIAKTPVNITDVQSKIESLLKGTKGTFGIAFKDLQSSEELYINASESFHAASTMKTPVMIEVFKQVSEGRFSLDDSIVVRNRFKSIVDGTEYSLNLSDDSDDGLYQSLGKKETIRSLVYKMITVSSNLSTNILIEKVGAQNVMKTMKEMGLSDIRVLRGVEDDKAFKAGMNNTTTAKDLMILFEHIAHKQAVSEKASEDMLSILFEQKFKIMIPALLPKEVKVAHKTGSITNIQHDSGIIYLPDGRKYILVVLSKELESNKNGIAAIAQISKIFYDYMME